MRTTLTLDDDVAAALARRRSKTGSGLRAEVNALLRAGLAAAESGAGADQGYALPTFDPGRILIDDSRALKELLEDEDVMRTLVHLR